MPGTLTYTEHAPPSDIAPWIACFWRIAGEGGRGEPLLHRVLPDGCADLVVDVDDARRGGGMPATIVGPMSRAGIVDLQGAVDIVGVRFRPGAIAAFSGVPASAILDASLPIGDLPQPLRISASALVGCSGVRCQFEWLSDACRRRLASQRKPDRIVAYALDQWARAESSKFPTVSHLIRDVALSERAFQRRFIAHVGLTPVQYRRISSRRADHDPVVCASGGFTALRGRLP